MGYRTVAVNREPTRKDRRGFVRCTTLLTSDRERVSDRSAGRAPWQVCSPFGGLSTPRLYSCRLCGPPGEPGNERAAGTPGTWRRSSSSPSPTTATGATRATSGTGNVTPQVRSGSPRREPALHGRRGAGTYQTWADGLAGSNTRLDCRMNAHRAPPRGKRPVFVRHRRVDRARRGESSGKRPSGFRGRGTSFDPGVPGERQQG
jgi:hypothetical protein